MEPRNRARRLRKEPTEPEYRLWRALSARKIADARFNRQVPIGDYICDFVARTHRLVIEIDGDTHAGRAGYDARRTKELERLGYRVIRFGNNDVMANLERVVLAIEAALAALPFPNPSRRREGD